MINVIMPCYNPKKELLDRALLSLRKQTYQDFQITIVNDCGSSEFEEWITDFSDLKITVLNREKNGGCGEARQTGIDNTDCEFFMFLDCDDYLFKNALEVLINASEKADMVESVFGQEISDKKMIPINPGKQSIWMHGKLYRTSFIKENQIHFYDGIRYNEDYGFNMLVREMSDKVVQINTPTYVWCKNRISTTREGGLSDYAIHNSEQQLMTICYCLNYLIEHNKKINYVNLVCVMYDLHQYCKCVCDNIIDKKLIKKILNNELVIESFKKEGYYLTFETLKQYKNVQGITVFFTQTFIDWLIEFNAKEIINILVDLQGVNYD